MSKDCRHGVQEQLATYPTVTPLWHPCQDLQALLCALLGQRLLPTKAVLPFCIWTALRHRPHLWLICPLFIHGLLSATWDSGPCFLCQAHFPRLNIPVPLAAPLGHSPVPSASLAVVVSSAEMVGRSTARIQQPPACSVTAGQGRGQWGWGEQQRKGPLG